MDNDLINKIKESEDLDELLKIQRQINKFSLSGNLSKNNDYLLFENINVEEAYTKKYMLLGVLGYVWQALKEWEPSKEYLEYDYFNDETIKGNIPNILDILHDSNELQKKGIELKDIYKRCDKYYNDISNEKYFEENNIDEFESFYEKMYEYMKTFIEYGDSMKTYLKNGLLPQLETLKLNKLLKKISNDKLLYNKITKKHANNIVNEFMKKHFEYNPNEHVKSSMKLENLPYIYKYNNTTRAKNPDLTPELNMLYKDMTYTDTLANLTYNILYNTKYEEKDKLINNVKSLCELSEEEKNKFKELLCDIEVKNIPEDTIYRLFRYIGNNYEKLNDICDDLFVEKKSFSSMLAFHKVINANNDDELDKEMKKYSSKYEHNIKTKLCCGKIGKWIDVSECKQNRESKQILNRDAIFMEELLEKYEDNKKIHNELTKKKVEVTKATNIKNEGPDAEMLMDYKKNFANNIGSNSYINDNKKKNMIISDGELDKYRLLNEKEDILNDLNKYTHKLNRGNKLNDYDKEQISLLIKQYDEILDSLKMPDNAIKYSEYINDGSSFIEKVQYTESIELDKDPFNNKELSEFAQETFKEIDENKLEP